MKHHCLNEILFFPRLDSKGPWIFFFRFSLCIVRTLPCDLFLLHPHSEVKKCPNKCDQHFIKLWQTSQKDTKIVTAFLAVKSEGSQFLCYQWKILLGSHLSLRRTEERKRPIVGNHSPTWAVRRMWVPIIVMGGICNHLHTWQVR